MNTTSYNAELDVMKEPNIIYGDYYAPESDVIGTDEDDIIYAQGGNNTIFAGAGDDIIFAGDGDDIVYGGEGNDLMYGGAGNDTIYAGKGNDRLDGGLGDDTYIYALGDGVDVINNFARDGEDTNDVLILGEGIKASDLVITQESNRGKAQYDLKISFSNSPGDALYLENILAGNGNINQYKADNAQFHEIQFSDGTIWKMSDLLANQTHIIYGAHGEDSNIVGKQEHKNIIYAGPGDDIILGGNRNDTIYAGDGDDIIKGGKGDDLMYGGAGDDTIFAGEGNDRLDGGLGSDTYIYQKGDGQDVIRNYAEDDATSQDTLIFGKGINASDLVITQESHRGQDGYDIKISFKSSPGDALFLEGVLAGADLDNKNVADLSKIDRIQFADGTVWSMEDLFYNTAFLKTGTDGDDIITGDEGKNNLIKSGDGNDTIYGGNREDIIYAGNGDDTIYGGYGNDTIYGGHGDDTIYAGSGDDVINGDCGDDTIYGAAGNDTIDGGCGNDLIFAGNGSDTIQGGKGNDIIYAGSGDDIIYGSEGNDLLFGDAGDDILYSGAGNDHLAGGTGNDTYVYNLGDGVDSIDNYAVDNATAHDVLIFGEGITFADLIITKESNRGKPGFDMRIQIQGTDDVIFLENAFTDSSNQHRFNNSKLHEIKFSEDNSSFSMDDLIANIITPVAIFSAIPTDIISINNNINGLIDAMASFSVSGAGVSSFDSSNYANLDMILTASA